MQFSTFLCTTLILPKLSNFLLGKNCQNVAIFVPDFDSPETLLNFNENKSWKYYVIDNFNLPRKISKTLNYKDVIGEDKEIHDSKIDKGSLSP